MEMNENKKTVTREQEKLRSGIINAARRFSGDPDIDEAMDEYVLYSRK